MVRFRGFFVFMMKHVDSNVLTLEDAIAERHIEALTKRRAFGF